MNRIFYSIYGIFVLTWTIQVVKGQQVPGLVSGNGDQPSAPAEDTINRGSPNDGDSVQVSTYSDSNNEGSDYNVETSNANQNGEQTSQGFGYSGPTPPGGINLLKTFEAFRPNFKLDPNGQRKIGYSHNCDLAPDKCANMSPPITIQDATELLKSDLIPFEECVRQNVKYSSLNPPQFGALVAFVYNLGCDYFKQTILLQLLNAGNVREAADEFAKHTEFQGKVWPGLVKRRKEERDLFCARSVCQP